MEAKKQHYPIKTLAAVWDKKGFAQIMLAPEKHPHFIYNFANWSSYVWGIGD